MVEVNTRSPLPAAKVCTPKEEGGYLHECKSGRECFGSGAKAEG